MSKNDLKIDWATYEAAKYACQNWHYSKCMPSGKLVKIGVWEFGKFIGVVIFGNGANHNMSKAYNLKQNEACELVRIALNKHKNAVSRISALAIKFLTNKNPGLRLIISYADPEQGHHGGVYQAGNWFYKGLSASSVKVWYKNKWSHKKTVDDSGVDQRNLRKKKVAGKHTYLMPLDKNMRKKIVVLSKPYPKRASSETSDTPDLQSGKGGATPTDALHPCKE